MTRVVLALAATLLIGAGLGAAPAAAEEVASRLLFDNPRMAVFELTLPAGFEGEVHTAPFDEGAYVLEGELTVITVPSGREVVRPGQWAWAAKGTIHKTANPTTRPTRFLVIILKEP
jgi:quercetin dioxygenase-like cupin family protein